MAINYGKGKNDSDYDLRQRMQRIDIPGLAVLLMHVFMYQNEILLDRGMGNI